MIYLAAPYWHESPVIRAERSRKAGRAMLDLAKSGIFAIAPTFYGHEMTQKFHAALSESHWRQWSRCILVQCSEIYLVTMEGWRESAGCREECQLAVSLCMPITGYAPEDGEQVSGLDIRKQFDLPILRAKGMRPL